MEDHSLERFYDRFAVKSPDGKGFHLSAATCFVSGLLLLFRYSRFFVELFLIPCCSLFVCVFIHWPDNKSDSMAPGLTLTCEQPQLPLLAPLHTPPKVIFGHQAANDEDLHIN